jgi:hypothetical protein
MIHMSPVINVGDVTAVLISGRWYSVADASFALDAYELAWKVGTSSGAHLGGRGFSFKTSDGDFMAGPLDGVAALRHGPQGDPWADLKAAALGTTTRRKMTK